MLDEHRVHHTARIFELAPAGIPVDSGVDRPEPTPRASRRWRCSDRASAIGPTMELARALVECSGLFSTDIHGGLSARSTLAQVLEYPVQVLGDLKLVMQHQLD